ncbi:hypothetical protein AA0121_g8259 [Alternaria tenuissima]|nr:hypothetical protein AA0121_g8259 [Alternaria tenuissima]
MFTTACVSFRGMPLTAAGSGPETTAAQVQQHVNNNSTPSQPQVA